MAKFYIEDGRGGWREVDDHDAETLSVQLPEAMVDPSLPVQAMSPTPTGDNYVDEAGTSVGTRLLLKWFANDADVAEKFLVSIGYEINRPREASLTEPFPLWVRKSDKEPWRPVDPVGGSLKEGVLDLLDLTADTAQGALTSAAGAAGFAVGLPAGGVGGPLLGAASAGAVGGLLEHSRQAAGQMMGLPQEPSLARSAGVGMMSSVGGLVPPAGNLRIPTGGAIPGITDRPPGFWTKFSAKVTGTKPELLRERIRIKGFGRLPDQAKELDDIRTALNRLEFDPETGKFGLQLPARMEADEIVKAASGKAKVDLRPVFDRMAEYTNLERQVPRTVEQTVEREARTEFARASQTAGTTLKEVERKVGGRVKSADVGEAATEIGGSAGTTAERVTRTTKTTKDVAEFAPRSYEMARIQRIDDTVPGLAERVLNNFRKSLEEFGIDPARVPAEVAEEFKSDLQRMVHAKRGYDNTDLTKAGVSMLKEFAGLSRRQTEIALDSTGLTSSSGRKYSEAMEALSESMENIATLRKAFFRGRTEDEQLASAEATMKALHGTRRGTHRLAALEHFDAILGTNMAERARQASMAGKFGESFGEMGQPNWIPRFTAAGRVLGPGMFTPAAYGIGGAALAGGPGFGLAAMGLASPRAQLALGKMGTALTGAARGRVSGAMQSGPGRTIDTALLAEMARSLGPQPLAATIDPNDPYVRKSRGY